MSGSEVTVTPIRFRALDGYELGGTIHRSVGTAEPATAVILNSGGGVPAVRYSKLARYLAAQGFPVLTYDYRGIGASRPGNLRRLSAGVEDWSQFDCGGAIAWLRSSYAKSELVAVSHSLGSLLVGGAPNVGEISRFVFIGAHTGYYKDYLRKYRIPMALLWHGLMPVLTRIFGYFPARRLRLGEDIPAGVAMQWAARRGPDLRPESISDVQRGRELAMQYTKVTGNVLVYEITDDAFATQAGTRRLLATFPGLRASLVRIVPSAVGMKKIGHFGYFRRQAEVMIWPQLVAYLRGDSQFVPHEKRLVHNAGDGTEGSAIRSAN